MVLFEMFRQRALCEMYRAGLQGGQQETLGGGDTAAHSRVASSWRKPQVGSSGLLIGRTSPTHIIQDNLLYRKSADP